MLRRSTRDRLTTLAKTHLYRDVSTTKWNFPYRLWSKENDSWVTVRNGSPVYLSEGRIERKAGLWHEIGGTKKITKRMLACMSFEKDRYPQVSAPIIYEDSTNVFYVDVDYHDGNLDRSREDWEMLEALGFLVMWTSERGLGGWLFLDEVYPRQQLQPLASYLKSIIPNLDKTTLDLKAGDCFSIPTVCPKSMDHNHPKVGENWSSLQRLPHPHTVPSTPNQEPHPIPSGISDSYSIEGIEAEVRGRLDGVLRRLLEQTTTTLSESIQTEEEINWTKLPHIPEGCFQYEVMENHIIPRSLTMDLTKDWVEGVSAGIPEASKKNRLDVVRWFVQKWERDPRGPHAPLLAPNLSTRLWEIAGDLVPESNHMRGEARKSWMMYVASTLLLCIFRSKIEPSFILTINQAMKLTGFLKDNREKSFETCKRIFHRGVMKRLLDSGYLNLEDKVWLKDLYPDQSNSMNLYSLGEPLLEVSQLLSTYEGEENSELPLTRVYNPAIVVVEETIDEHEDQDPSDGRADLQPARARGRVRHRVQPLHDSRQDPEGASNPPVQQLEGTPECHPQRTVQASLR